MSGFDAGWLALREPADVRARDKGLLVSLAAHFEGAPKLDIVDLGCGTGSNLRAMALAFSDRTEQRWTLVDNDPKLLGAAKVELKRWAGTAQETGDILHLRKDARRIQVRFLPADLRDPRPALSGEVDIVTAAAFFDLVSQEWITRFVEATSAASAIYAALTYNGAEAWSPRHPADGAMLAAFHAHQRRDKGFGPAAGPAASDMLKEALASAGYEVETGESPWRLGENGRALIEALADGSAAALAELGYFDRAAMNNWRESRRRATACVIGHTDCLALRR